MERSVSSRHHLWLFLLSFFFLSARAVSAQDKPATPEGPSAAAVENLQENDFTDFHEDFTTPKLNTSTLEIKSALIGQKSQLSGCSLEVARVKWRPSDPVDIYICVPKGVEKLPVVIYLYGSPIYEKRYGDENWYGRTTNGGYATVAIFPAISGPRFHPPRPIRQNFLSQLPETLAMTAHDLQMVINYLSTRKDLNLDLDNIGVFATSFGATSTILAAAVDPRIKAIDLLNPWGDWPDWFAKSEVPSFLACDDCGKPEFLQSLALLDPVKWIPALKTPHIRFRHFVENGETPRLSQDKMEAVAPKDAEIVRFENVTAFNRSAVAGKTFEWIKAFVSDNQAPTQVVGNTTGH
jgi:hypothetical protein